VVLQNALTPILGDYDFAVLDCPPSLGLLTVNALTAADFFIVPLTPDYLTLEGLVNLMDAVEKIRSGNRQLTKEVLQRIGRGV
jgi:chromosome partitioning protein